MAKKNTGSPKWMEKEKRWRIKVQRDGTRKSFYSSTPGRKGKMECQAKADKWLDGELANGNPFVSDLYDAWVEEVRANVSANSARTHASNGRNYIIPAIGSLRVAKLRSEQTFQNIINSAFKSGVKGKPLAKLTLRNLMSSMKQFVKYCRKCGYTHLILENLYIPKPAVHNERIILQPDEIRVVFTHDEIQNRNFRKDYVTKREWFIYAFRFALLTGLRPGELIGLKWSDLSNGILHIRRAINSRREETSGKNANARRDIMLPGHAIAILDEQRKHLAEHGVTSEYIFSSIRGKATSQGILREHLARFCADNDITKITPYCFRHTWYSINKTMPLELIKRIGGHSESMDTFGVYGHDVDGELEEAAGYLDAIMEKILNNES